MGYDWEAVKRVDLASVIGQYAAESHRSGQRVFFYSPVRQERTASLVVDTGKNTWFDYGANTGGDAVDFMRYIGRDNVRDAIEALNVGTTVTQWQPRPQREQKQHPRLTIDNVKRWAAQADPTAIRYFENRHVSRYTTIGHSIGVDEERPWVYQTRSGRKLYLSCRRYIIPYLFNGNLRRLAERRDDTDARARLENFKVMDPAGYAEVVTELGTSDENILLDRLFGAKYLHPGEGLWVFNAQNHLVVTENGIPVYYEGKPLLKPLKYIIVSEGEIDALTAESAGYPAVASKAHFANRAMKVVIIADNDEPGKKMAMNLAQQMPNSQVLVPYQGYKDLNDLERAGLLDRFLSQYGIYPEFERQPLCVPSSM